MSGCASAGEPVARRCECNESVAQNGLSQVVVDPQARCEAAKISIGSCQLTSVLDRKSGNPCVGDQATFDLILVAKVRETIPMLILRFQLQEVRQRANRCYKRKRSLVSVGGANIL